MNCVEAFESQNKPNQRTVSICMHVYTYTQAAERKNSTAIYSYYSNNRIGCGSYAAHNIYNVPVTNKCGIIKHLCTLLSF